jgi:hypothetical protein
MGDEMTARDILTINALERDRVRALVVRHEISRGRAKELRRERLRRLRSLLLLRFEATRGRDGASPREWYIRQVSRATWAIDRARP